LQSKTQATERVHKILVYINGEPYSQTDQTSNASHSRHTLVDPGKIIKHIQNIWV